MTTGLRTRDLSWRSRAEVCKIVPWVGLWCSEFEPQWLKRLLRFPGSVIFVDIDSFEVWRSLSPFVKDLMGKKTLEESISQSVTKKWSSKKRSMKSDTTEIELLFGYDDLYTSKRIYEDMAIFITDKFVEYSKKSVASRSLPGDTVALVTPFSKERDYLEK